MAGPQRPTDYKTLMGLASVIFFLSAPSLLGKQNAFDLTEIAIPDWLGWSIWGSGFVLGWLGLRNLFAGEVRSTQFIGKGLIASIFGLGLLMSAIHYRTEIANIVNTTPHRAMVTFVKVTKPESTGYRRDLFGPRCPMEFGLLDQRQREKSLCVEGKLLAPIRTDSARYCKDQTLELRGRISSLGFAVDSIHAITTCQEGR